MSSSRTRDFPEGWGGDIKDETEIEAWHGLKMEGWGGTWPVKE